jgi:hypothetical protein
MSGTEEPKQYERQGRPDLPKWWTDLAFPLIRAGDNKQIAARASIYAGRKKAWGGDAISKFVSGVARTRELANGISRALGVPQPFFEARTAKESEAISAVMELAASTGPTPEQQRRLMLLDQLKDEEQRSANGQTERVSSKNEARGHGRRRAGRATRGRT